MGANAKLLLSVTLMAAMAMLSVWAMVFVWPVFPSRRVREFLDKDFSARHLAYYSTNMSTAGRQETPCAAFAQPRSATFLIFGQSNAANYVASPEKPKGEIGNLNIFDGKCYAAADPLLGAGGAEGSLWIRMANDLIADHAYDRILLVSMGEGSSFIRQWAPGGFLYPKLSTAIARVKDKNIAPAFVIFYQGEADADANTDPVVYVSAFRAISDGLRGARVDAPIVAAVAGGCTATSATNMVSARHAILSLPGIIGGPNPDLYPHRNGCHFDGPVADTIAAEFAQKIESARAATGK